MRALLNTNQGDKRQWSSMINNDVCVRAGGGIGGESINIQLS